jgi:copper chaperone CopZ
MPRRALLTALIVTVIGLAFVLAASPSPERMRATFTVDGVHCDGCSATITTNLKRVKGASDAGPDHAAGRLWAVYAPARTTVDAMERAIDGLAYTVGAATSQVEPTPSVS